jgi:phage shock protein PspC (stress-responsive transcriptional regulator)
MLVNVSGTGSNVSVEDTLKDFWATRPRRPRHGRKIAGVAAALGDRYGIDPVIIRVALVVATFYGGAGILFYLLGWLFLAEEGDEVSPIEALRGAGRSSSSAGFTIALGAAMIPVSWWFFDHDVTGFLSIAIVAGLLFLLHRGRGHLGRPGSPRGAAPMADAPPLYAESMAAGPTVAWDPIQPDAPQTPPAWDPLGAAPFAWDLPEPSSPEPPPQAPVPRSRSKVGIVTVAIAFLTVGAAVLLWPVAGGWLSVPHVIGVVLGILGLGMVAGGFTRGGRGLIGLAVPLAIVGIAMTTLFPNGFTEGGIGETTQRPTSLEQVMPMYQRSIGEVTLDLTGLPNEGTVKTKAKVDVGDVTVIVPENADVRVRCSARVGDVQCLGKDESGTSADVSMTDQGPDGPGGLVIELDAEAASAGSVEVRRG